MKDLEDFRFNEDKLDPSLALSPDTRASPFSFKSTEQTLQPPLETVLALYHGALLVTDTLSQMKVQETL